MLKTKERKILAAILAIALLILMVDQFSGGPAPADAQSDTPAASIPRSPQELPTATNSAEPVATEAIADAGPSVARMLSVIRGNTDYDPQQVDNAFAPSSQWAGDAQNAQPQTDDRSDAEAFVQAHRVTAIMRGERGGYAIINGNIVRVGQKLNGFTLIEVSPSAVVFRSEKWEIELPLETGK